MACGHIIKQSFNQFCCQRIHSGIITILQIQFRCLLQTRDFHIKKVTFKTIIFKHMLPGSQAEGNKTQHKKTIQTVCSVVIFSVLLSLTSFGEALLSRGGREGGIGRDCMSLVWISKPIVLHPQEEGMSLSVFTIIVFVPFFLSVAVWTHLRLFVTTAAVMCCSFKARSLVRPQQGLFGARHEFFTIVLKHVYLMQWAWKKFEFQLELG